MSRQLIRLTDRALLSLRGEDAASLLQGLCTNDVRNLTKHAALAAFMLNNKGRIIEDVIMYRNKDDIVVECDARHRLELKTLLEKFRMRKKVSIEECDMGVLWAADSSKGAVADPRFPAMGGRRLGPEEGDAPLGEYTRLRHSHGVAEGRSELETLLPFQANGDALNYVSLDKGCYVGQELTARTAHTGVVRRRLLPFQAAKQVMGEVQDEEGRKVGEVIGSNDKGGIALLSLSSLGRRLMVGGEEVAARRPDWMDNRLLAVPEGKKKAAN